jgi:hypothetical protein
MTDEEKWRWAFENSQLRKAQVAAGVIRHPYTGLHQTWSSLTGHDVNLMTAHRSEADARETIDRFNEAWRAGDLTTPEAVVKFLDSLPSDARPSPLPEESLRAIGQFINEMLAEKESTTRR